MKLDPAGGSAADPELCEVPVKVHICLANVWTPQFHNKEVARMSKLQLCPLFGNPRSPRRWKSSGLFCFSAAACSNTHSQILKNAAFRFASGRQNLPLRASLSARVDPFWRVFKVYQADKAS